MCGRLLVWELLKADAAAKIWREETAAAEKKRPLVVYSPSCLSCSAG